MPCRSARIAPALLALIITGCDASIPAPEVAIPPPPSAATPPGAAPAPAPDAEPAPEGSGGVLRVGGYDLDLPSWWASVDVGELPSLPTKDAVGEYVRKTYGADVGTEDTWKMAAKVWVLAEYGRNRIPIFFAHCLMTGKDFMRAARIYAELQRFARTRINLGEYYGCYLAYSAGKAYESAGMLDEAARWYHEAVAYISSQHTGIQQYAYKSRNALKAMGK